MELDEGVEYFDKVVRQYAKPVEVQTFDNLVKTAQRSIDRNDADFDNITHRMTSLNMTIMMRQDWFIVDWYKYLTASSVMYMDQVKFRELKRLGDLSVAKGDIKQLRAVLYELWTIRIHTDSGEGMFDIANIVKG